MTAHNGQIVQICMGDLVGVAVSSDADCTGGLSFRSDVTSTPVIKPDGRPLPRITADDVGSSDVLQPTLTPFSNQALAC